MGIQQVNSGAGFAYHPGESANPRIWDASVLCIAPCVRVGGPRYLNNTTTDLSPSRCDGGHDGGLFSAGLFGDASPIGRSLKLTNLKYIYWDATTRVIPTKLGTGALGTVTLTMQVYFRYVAKGSVNNMCLYRTDNPAGGDLLTYGYGLYVEANTGDLVFFVNRQNLLDPDLTFKWRLATSPYPATFTALTGGKWHHVIVTYCKADYDDPEINQYVMYCIDGQWIYPGLPGAGEIVSTHLSTKNARIGAMTESTAPDFEFSLLNVWARRLGWREIDQLMVDPLAMFRRRRSGGGKGSRLISIGGTALRRLNVAVAG